MHDEEFADALVLRLNEMIEDPDVREDIGNLMDQGVLVSETTLHHTTIQCCVDDPEQPRLRLLGLLNGLTGSKEPLITAVFNDDDYLESFERTGAPNKKKTG